MSSEKPAFDYGWEDTGHNLKQTWKNHLFYQNYVEDQKNDGNKNQMDCSEYFLRKNRDR